MVGAIGLLASWLASAGPAAALCGGTGTPAGALRSGQLVFVGVVESVSNLDRWATVHVEEVWSHGDLAEWVEVRGSEERPGWDIFGIFATLSSNDTYYRRGQRYLFVPNIRNGHLDDFSCTPTMPWDPSLEALRPATAHPPTTDTMPSPVPWLLVMLGAVALGGGVLVMLRRR